MIITIHKLGAQLIARFRPIALTALAGLALSACQTTSSAGQGDVNLSKEVASAFVRDYIDEPYPLAFAVSTGGQYWYYRYCDGPKCSNPTNDINETLKKCQSKGNLPCNLFAYRKSIVWKKSDGSTYTIEDVYNVLGMSAEDRLKMRYANMANIPLCQNALAEKGAAWTDKYTNRLYVDEALNRDMTPEFCAKLAGR